MSERNKSDPKREFPLDLNLGDMNILDFLNAETYLTELRKIIFKFPPKTFNELPRRWHEIFTKGMDDIKELQGIAKLQNKIELRVDTEVGGQTISTEINYSTDRSRPKLQSDRTIEAQKILDSIKGKILFPNIDSVNESIILVYHLLSLLKKIQNELISELPHNIRIIPQCNTHNKPMELFPLQQYGSRKLSIKYVCIDCLREAGDITIKFGW